MVDPPILEFNDYEGDPLPETPKASAEVVEDLTKAADKLLRFVWRHSSYDRYV